MRVLVGQRRVLHSEEGVWAEGISGMSPWAQGDSSSLATCPWCRHGLATRQLNRTRRNSSLKERAVRCHLPPGCGSLRGGTGFQGKQCGHSPIAPHPSAWAVCWDTAASPLLLGRHWPRPRVRLSARRKGQALPTPGNGRGHRVQS